MRDYRVPRDEVESVAADAWRDVDTLGLYVHVPFCKARCRYFQDIYHLGLGAAMAKMVAVSFYFGEVHLEHFWVKFGARLEDHFAREVDFVLRRGLMEYVGSYLRLTPHGARHFNGVVALFYSGAVKEYLVNLRSEM